MPSPTARALSILSGDMGCLGGQVRAVVAVCAHFFASSTLGPSAVKAMHFAWQKIFDCFEHLVADFGQRARL